MKQLGSSNRSVRAFLLLAMVGWLFAGCASKPRIDWGVRVGNFTYDQTVAELGPPDKSAKLSDGTTIAEWFIKRSSSVTFGVGTGFYSSGSAVSVGQSVSTAPSGQYLKLTFGPDGRLNKWE